MLLLAAPAAAGVPIERCQDGTPEQARARAALERLDATMQALTPAAEVAPASRALAALMELPCFRLAAREGARALATPSSALALRTWWTEGGHEWLRAQLEPQPSSLSLPPDLRATLARESRPGHALFSLLCPLADAGCGRETAGWVLRAEQAFAEHARAGGPSLRPADDKAAARPEQKCAAQAHAGSSAHAYVRFHDCLEGARATRAAMPLGHTQAPRRGFWILAGRRGHYSFCDQIRVYDLATGGALIAQSCSGLALAQSGVVDQDRTDAARTVTLEAGRLPVENLREAVWMALLAREVSESVQTELQSFALPPGLTPRWTDGAPRTLGGHGSWMSSAQTQLQWSWVVDGAVVAQGALTWPDSAHAGEDHADELIVVAEAGFQPGCPPSLPPRPLPLGPTRAGVSAVDASPDRVDAVQRALRQRINDYQKPASCK